MLTNVGGWQSVSFADTNYDPSIGMDASVLIDFIQETQPRAWKRYVSIYKEVAEDRFVRRFNEEVTTHGLLHVLRKGIRDRGVHLRVIYFRPVSSISYDNLKLYEANRFHCIRQFYYSTNNRNSIDMVLAVNGIPLVALELKTNIQVKMSNMQNCNLNKIVTQENSSFSSTLVFSYILQ